MKENDFVCVVEIAEWFRDPRLRVLLCGGFIVALLGIITGSIYAAILATRDIAPSASTAVAIGSLAALVVGMVMIFIAGGRIRRARRMAAILGTVD